jgi:hypothetical protein
VELEGGDVLRLGGVVDGVGLATEAVEPDAGKSCADAKPSVVGVDRDARQVPTGGWRCLAVAAGVALNELRLPKADHARIDQRDDEVPLVVLQGIREQAPPLVDIPAAMCSDEFDGGI